MKEIYYGRIPLAVPIQKIPPSKYASHLYPTQVVENLSMYAAMNGFGVLLPVIADSFQVTASMNGFSVLKSIYHSYTIEAECLSSNTSMNGIGELKSVLKNYNLGKDTLIINNTSFNGVGTLKTVLISYTNTKESLKTLASMNGIGELK